MAKAIKHGLGRGLDALLGGAGDSLIPSDDLKEQGALSGDQVLTIKLTDVDPNRSQPRRSFSEDALRELADSIRAVGVIQPVIVRKSGARYQLIAGERRWRAARMAGLKELPAIVRDWDATKRLEVALIENLQRDDLNPVDQARGVKALMDQCGYTQEAASERLGMSRPAVANLLRLLTLPSAVLDMLREGKLSAGHARALAALTDENKQVRLANLCAAQGWSVRQLERVVKQPEPEKKEKPARAPEFKELERMARDVFGTKARIEGDAEKGKLVLSYYSQDDLQRIWEILECFRQSE